jgi:branched-chain amino acid transport system substrate-binding protein
MAPIRYPSLAASALAAAALALLAGGGTQARADEVLKIGAAVSQTGNFAREGEFLLSGYQLWKEKVNAAGGLKIGGKTYKVEIVPYDDESQAQTSAKLTEKLITEDKVQFLFGPYSSGIANATAAISERYKVLTIAPMATANNLFTRGYKYFFCPSAIGNTGLWPVLLLAKDVSPKPETVAIVGPDDLFPNITADGAKEKATELGFKVVYTGKYPKGAPDLSAVATNIKAANPDIVLGSGYSQDSILLVKALRELKIQPKLIGLATAVAVPDFRAALGSAASGIMGVDYWSPTLTYSDVFFKNSQQFAEDYEKRFGKPPYYHAAAGMAGGLVLQAAIEKAQSLDTAKVREAMLEITGQTFYTKYKFTEQGINSLATLYVSQIIDGEPKVVFPTDVAQAKFRYPMVAGQ